MTREIKRGAPFPSGQIRKEAQELGPYPTWDNWKYVVEKHLGIRLKDFKNSAESIFKEIYHTRRLIQKGADLNLWTDLQKKIDEEHPGFLDDDNNLGVIRFIVQKTESETIRDQAKRIRRGLEGISRS